MMIRISIISRRLGLSALLALGLLLPAFQPAALAAPKGGANLAAVDATSVADSAKKLKDSVQEQLKQAKRWEPAGKDKDFWTAVEAFDASAERLASEIKSSAKASAIAEVTMLTFIRLAQVNDSSATLQLDAAGLQSFTAARDLAGQMQEKYMARKNLPKNWDAPRGKSVDKEPLTGANSRAAAKRFINKIYGYPVGSIQAGKVVRVGVYDVVEAAASGKMFKIAIHPSRGVVVLERHIDKL